MTGHTLTEAELGHLADRLVEVPGICAVLLGGSRARGDHLPDSDVDLGLYYRPPLDVAALRKLARDVAGPSADVTAPGSWGPWVDGGGWLAVDGVAVDWIYRDLERVRQSWRDAQAGRFDFHFQVGHPLGVPDFAYAGEVALGVVLADPSGELVSLKGETTDYPPRLRDAIDARLEEARFLLGALPKAAGRGDTTYVAGCLFRVVGLCAHALHAKAGRWVINEKGLVAAAGRLTTAPPHFSERAHGILATLGRGPEELSAAVASAAGLVAEVSAADSPDRG